MSSVWCRMYQAWCPGKRFWVGVEREPGTVVAFNATKQALLPRSAAPQHQRNHHSGPLASKAVGRTECVSWGRQYHGATRPPPVRTTMLKQPRGQDITNAHLTELVSTTRSRVGPIHSAVTVSVSNSCVRLTAGRDARSMVPLAMPLTSVTRGRMPEALVVDQVRLMLAPATEAPM